MHVNKPIIICIFVILTLSILLFVYTNRNDSGVKTKDEFYNISFVEKSNNNNEIQTNIESEVMQENSFDKDETIFEWKIEIPKIGLVANIAEGTSKEILDVFVGHFDSTKRRHGNVVLAAHNRGYPVNYFSKIKDLEINDEIYYTYNEFKQCYKLVSKEIIKDTDFTKLTNTDNDTITLITCVENRPSLRRCIVGKK